MAETQSNFPKIHYENEKRPHTTQMHGRRSQKKLNENDLQQENLEDENQNLSETEKIKLKQRLDEKKIENFANLFKNKKKSIDEIWFKKRNEEIAHKRQDEEFQVFMHKWAKNKEIVEEELNRRIESGHFGSRYNKLKFRPKSQAKFFEDNLETLNSNRKSNEENPKLKDEFDQILVKLNIHKINN